MRANHVIPGILAVGAALSVLFLPGCAGGSDPQPAAVGVVDQAGGTVEVTGGPLAGARIEIPAGALSGPVEFRIFGAYEVAIPGFASASAAMRIEPAGLALAQPATIRLPFREPSNGEAGFGGTLTEQVTMLVGVADDLENVVQLGGASQESMGFYDAATLRLGRFFLMVPLQNGLISPFLYPVLDGNVWNFANGSRIRMEAVPMGEPNRASLPGDALRLVIEGPSVPGSDPEQFGLYIQQTFDFNSPTLVYGEFRDTGNATFQQLHDPIPLLDVVLTNDRATQATVVFERHVPFTGGTTTTGVGRIDRLVRTGPPQVETPAGTFGSIVLIDFDMSFVDENGDAIDFATDWTLSGIGQTGFIGYVGARTFGLSSLLETANVNGVSIGD
jgi:hypothetical protein